MKKKIGILLTVLFCLLALPLNVNAAAKKVKIRINKTYSATIEESGKSWKVNPPKQMEKPFDAKVLYLELPAGHKLETGYYYFDKKGIINTKKAFHGLKTKINARRFNGAYYFGEANGRLSTKKRGLRVIGGRTFYLSGMGYRYENCWIDGYYAQEKGIIAKNMQVPDGSYVDCDGHKCAKEEMKLSGFKKELESIIKGYSGSWSVYVKDLKRGDVISINEKKMKPASVIKLFAMAGTYDSFKKGEIKQDARMNSLLESMITVSDNECFNSLVRKQSKYGSFVDGCKNLNRKLKALGCKATEAHSTLHPSSSPAASDGKSNFTTAKDAGMILEKIYKGQCVSSKYSKEMLGRLLRQTRRWKIPAGLPAGVKCANKTGENSGCQNDVAIVYGKKTDYVVCIFAETGEYYGIRGIKNLSSKIYAYLNK